MDIMFKISYTGYMKYYANKRDTKFVHLQLEKEQEQEERLPNRVCSDVTTDCVTASSVNMFKNKVDTYLRRAGYK